MVKITEDDKGNVKVYFGVGDMPMKVYEEFNDYSKKEFGDVRWMAIKQLLDIAKQSHQSYNVTYRIEELESDVSDIKQALESHNQGGEMIDYTLGSKGLKIEKEK